MPYPKHKTYQTWSECPRCGLDWPKSQLRRDCGGGKVCPECWDIPGFDEEKSKITLPTEIIESDNMEILL